MSERGVSCPLVWVNFTLSARVKGYVGQCNV